MNNLNKIALFISFFVSVLTVKSQVVINEYSCSNTNTVTDSYGENEDWIELYNTSGTAIDLNGYYISDKAGNTTKFQVPSSISIPANGYLLVFCNGRETVSGGQIHTSFKLTQTKFEKIVLSDGGGTIIDSLTLDPAQEGHSRGRTTDGATTWSLFTTPTAGVANANDKLDYAPRPVMDIVAGFYAGAQTVSLSATGTGVSIYYTLDGSTPTQSSTLYASPINISSTQVLRARSFSTDPNVPESFVETNTYFIGVTHTVPVVSVTGDDVMTLLTGTQIKPIGSLEFFDRQGVMKSEALGSFDKHGNDSWAYDQRGFDYVVHDQYGDNYSIKQKLFTHKSRTKFQRLIFKPAANDNYSFETGGAHIRDAYIAELSQKGKLKVDERSWDACILYVDGQYWGVYETREKYDDPDFTDYYYDQDEKYKKSAEYLQFLKTWGNTWTEYGEGTGPGSQAEDDWAAFLSFVQTNNMATAANFNYVDSVYNWKSLIDYFVLNSYVVSQDWLNWNTAWWRGINPNGDKKKWRYTLWDMDATFGHYINYTGIPTNAADADPCNVEGLPDPGGQGHTVILNALMGNATFDQYYKSRYIDLSNTVFKCTNMIGVLDSMINIIDPEMQGQVNKWGGTYAGWQQNVQTLRDYINTRCAAMDSGLIDCYGFTGPYDLKVNVSPVGAGDVKINSIVPNSYVYSGDYFGGIDILLKAKENTGFTFSHWEIFNNTLTSTTTDTTRLLLTSADSLVAHFTTEDTVNITYDVNPIGMGDIEIDGTIAPYYSYTQEHIVGSSVTLQEHQLADYLFDHWESDNHVLLPDTASPMVNFTVATADNITAVYYPIKGYGVPLAFSPNQDGHNDILYVYGGQIKSLSFQIYNRWGEMVFESKSQDEGWDGTFNGQNASSGVYVYKLKAIYLDGEIKTDTGDITLLR